MLIIEERPFAKQELYFKTGRVMRTKQTRIFYTEIFRKEILSVYYGSEESIAQISARFDVNIETVRSWVFRSNSEKNKKSVFENINNDLTMKKVKVFNIFTVSIVWSSQVGIFQRY